MNTNLYLFIFLILICFLIPLLFFYFKLRKKDYRLKIQETRLDQISQEISKKQHEIDFARRKLEEQKSSLEQENSRIKTEREKFTEEYHRFKSEQEKHTEESRRISEDKIFLEQENNKLQQRIQNVKEKFQNVINQIDRKNEEVENKIREVESEKENVEHDKVKLEAAKKEINNANKQIQNEYQKIRLEKDRLEKQKNELNEKENEIQEKERQLPEDRKSIDFEKERIKDEWKIIESKKEEFEKQARSLDEREKEIIERERQIEIDKKFIEGEKGEIENECQQIQWEREEFEKQDTKSKKQANDLKKKQEQIEHKEKQLDARNQELDENVKKLNIEREEFERIKHTPPIEPMSEGAKRKPKTERPPHRRGSRRPLKSDGHERKKRIIPELICWEKGRRWHLGIQISRQISEDLNVQIIQNDENLVKDKKNENCWILKRISPLRIKWQGENGLAEKPFNLLENEDDFLILFKLIGKDEKHGKLVRNPVSGAYCAIVPDKWQRDEELSESAPCEPEQFFISGYKVHFFYLRRNSGFSLAFIKPDGKKAIRDPKGFRFSLSGNQIPDANDEIGPLFGDELPKIIDSQSWNGIETIVIGEEGEGIGKLRWEYKPDLKSYELDLNQLVEQGDIGILKSNKSWFFIRFYDSNDRLVECLDFRYIQGLKKIKISDHPFIPLPNGHRPIDIKLFHDKSCKINIDKDQNDRVTIKHDDEGTIATIPPDPACDLTDWEIQDHDDRKVNVELLVERIWWNLYDEKNPLTSNTWSDKPLNILKDYFVPTSHQAISLQFPKPEWIKNITLGFDKKKSRSYKVLSTQRSIKIPLREFCDCEEISKPIEQAKLLFWINIDGLQDEVVIAKIESRNVLSTEFKPEPAPIDLDKKPCCSTCSHAIERKRLNAMWCRRYHWPQTDIENFQENIAHFKCGEWRGEYKNENGEWVPK